jgi:hypothetical protein
MASTVMSIHLRKNKTDLLDPKQKRQESDVKLHTNGYAHSVKDSIK